MIGATAATNQQGDGFDKRKEMFAKLTRRSVSPMEVLEDQHQGPLARDAFEEPPHTTKDLSPHGLAVEVLDPMLESGPDR